MTRRTRKVIYWVLFWALLGVAHASAHPLRDSTCTQYDESHPVKCFNCLKRVKHDGRWYLKDMCKRHHHE